MNAGQVVKELLLHNQIKLDRFTEKKQSNSCCGTEFRVRRKKLR